MRLCMRQSKKIELVNESDIILWTIHRVLRWRKWFRRSRISISRASISIGRRRRSVRDSRRQGNLPVPPLGVSDAVGWFDHHSSLYQSVFLCHARVPRGICARTLRESTTQLSLMLLYSAYYNNPSVYSEDWWRDQVKSHYLVYFCGSYSD